ncbi:MAG: RNA polymerase sigma factor [Ruminococcus flavefaciens]|nr:RNA polymerase sigma factor [Ruminococcus flavefaciens]MCM1229825.1 RNA polymerase sigma factor [Ruminococcus flavefaciens]
MDKENTSLYAFRKYGDTVLRTAYACCGNYAEAEDITQDVFLLLHSKTVEFDGDEHLKAWLLRVTINKCRNFHRSFRVSHTQSLEDTDGLSSPYTADTDESGIREAIANLPKKYSSVIYLYYYEGYNIREIGEILNKNANTVSSLLQRGREKLRLEMEETL